MRRARPNKQGYLDGLCGIYALTNFLRDWHVADGLFLGGTHEDRSKDAADRLGMLNPDFILRGYASHHLVKIWNTLSTEADLQSHAVLLSKLRRLGKELTNLKIAECVYGENPTQALVLLHDDHWLLTTGVEGARVMVADSANRDKGREALPAIAINDPDLDGFAILRDRSKILACVREKVDNGHRR